MKSRDYITQVLSFVVFISIQLLFTRNMVIYGVAFNYIYVGFLLLLPFDTSRLLLLGLGFLSGLFIDIFYDSLGIHAASAVAIMFVRPWWINIITPRGGYDDSPAPLLNQMGFQWFSTYAFPLIIIHHACLFYIEVGGSTHFWFSLTKVIFSSGFTFATLVVLQYLFFEQRRRIL